MPAVVGEGLAHRVRSKVVVVKLVVLVTMRVRLARMCVRSLGAWIGLKVLRIPRVRKRRRVGSIMG